MKRLAIIGAGDLGQQIAFHASSDGQCACVGFLDDFIPVGVEVDGMRIIGKLDDALLLHRQGVFDCLIIGIGYRHMEFRKTLFNKLSTDIPFHTLIHSTAIVAKNASVGAGSVVFPGCIIDLKTNVGRNVMMYNGCNISHDVKLDDHVMLSPGVQLAGFSKVGSASRLGIGTIVIDNISLCEGTITGAGAVVVRSTLEPGLYLGCPAKRAAK